MRNLILVTVACYAYSGSFAQTLDPKTAGALAKFGVVVVTGSAELISDSLTRGGAPSAGEVNSDLQLLSARYNSEVKAASFAADLSRANGEVIITAGQVLASTSGVGAIPSMIVGAAARYGNDAFANAIAREGKSRALGFLDSGLKTMTKMDRQSFNVFVKAENYSAAIDLFEKNTSKLAQLEKSFGSDWEAASAARKLVYESLATASSAALAEAGKAHGAASKVEGQLKDYVRTTKQFAKEVSTRVKNLEDASRDLKVSVEDLSASVDAIKLEGSATAQQVSLMSQVLFEQQPPQTRLALLEANAYPGLTVGQRMDMKRILQTEIKKQEVLSMASRVVTVATDVNTILTNFGIEDERLSEAVKFGTIATSAMSQALTGNYLGAIASVSGLFGGGQPDPTQAQFEKVFKELADIRERVDKIIELQKQTLVAIEQLSRQLADVERNLNDRLDRVDFELARVDSVTRSILWSSYDPCAQVWGLRANSAWQYDEVGGFRSAVGLSAMLSDRGGAVFQCADKLSGVFSSMLSAGAFDNPMRIEHVSNVLPAAPPPSNDRAFSASDLQRFVEHVYRPSAELTLASVRLRQAGKAWGALGGPFLMMASPARTSTELTERVRKLDLAGTDRRLFACNGSSWLPERAKTLLCTDGFIFNQASHGGNEGLAEQRAERFLREPIIRDQVRDIAGWTALVASAADFARAGNPASPVMSLEELASAGYSPDATPGRQLLLGALMLSDIAIAQHSLVYGDLTAYFVFEALWDRQARRFRTPQTDVEKTATKLLKNDSNPWLQRNVAMLVLEAQLRPCAGCDADDLAFRIALAPFFEMSKPADGGGTLASVSPETERRGSSQMLALFDLDPATLFTARDLNARGAPVERRVVMRSNGIDLVIPSANDWSHRAMSYPPEVYSRLREREVLASRWADYVSLRVMGIDRQTRISAVLIGASQK